MYACLVLFLSCLWVPVAGKATHSALPEDLSAWIKVAPPQEGSQALYAANYSHYEWEVAVKNGRPVAHLQHDTPSGRRTLPPELERARKSQGKNTPLEAGEVSSCKVKGGWLIAFDAGEFGGSLWWYAADGEQRYRISCDQISQFLSTSHGLFALEGLAHLGISRGQVVQLAQDAQGHWTSTRFVQLGHAPYAGVVDTSGSLIVATTNTLVQVHPDRTQTVLLAQVFWGFLYPRSMVQSPTGDIYLGMRHGVSRVHQVNHRYVADWLLPNREFVDAKPEL